MRKRILPLRLRLRFYAAVLVSLSFLSFSLSLFSCASLVEFAGRKLSGDSYRGGIAVDEAAGKLSYSQAFYRGWLEFTADYIADEGIVTITRGALKRDDTVITGTEALGILQNRLDRIDALAAWMAQSGYARPFAGRKDFEEYWRAILLPETVSRKKRPARFAAEAATVPAEGYQWNTAYTAFLFPLNDKNEKEDKEEKEVQEEKTSPQNAELAKMRDSGALLRDFEEAVPWIEFQYQTKTRTD
ncbi:MAG: hypothetical protein LBL31_04310 [Spirochaetaceae bacterium]|nr:hypothetical protein [Spirochaetaceae bacterium]